MLFFASDWLLTLGNLKPWVLRLCAITCMRSYLARTPSCSARGRRGKGGAGERTRMMIIWPCVVYSGPLTVQQPICVTVAQIYSFLEDNAGVHNLWRIQPFSGRDQSPWRLSLDCRDWLFFFCFFYCVLKWGLIKLEDGLLIGISISETFQTDYCLSLWIAGWPPCPQWGGKDWEWPSFIPLCVQRPFRRTWWTSWLRTSFSPLDVQHFRCSHSSSSSKEAINRRAAFQGPRVFSHSAMGSNLYGAVAF